MPMDVAKAREAGYSDAEIADFLAGTSKFDAASARQSGYTDSEIIQHLVDPPKPPVTAMDRVMAPVSGAYSGIAEAAGLPADALMNVLDLGKAAAGFAQGEVTGKPPSAAFDPADRSQYPLTSQWLKQKMGKVGIETEARRPDDLASRVMHFGGDLGAQAFIGGGLPAPKGAGAAVAPNAKLASLQRARAEGYVVPPTTANPTVLNRLIESIGGKAATAQEAAVRNQNVTDALAKKAVGLDEGAQLIEGVLPAIRKEAAQAYEPLRKLGTMRADAQYHKELDAILQKSMTAAKSFPGMVKDDIAKVVESARVKSFESESALDAISLLRENADKAFRQGDAALGKAYKAVSGAMEGAIERGLERRGSDGNALLDAFRKARTLIAKTYSTEGALNAQTGQVNARKLAADLAKGKPLTGPLRKIAEFGRSFPEAAPVVKGSPGVSNLDMAIGGGSAAVTEKPWWLLYPLLRQGARKAMLSDTGQNLMTQPRGDMDPRSAMALLMGSNSLTQ